MTHKKWVDSTHLQFDIRVVCHLEGQSNDTRVRVETTHLFLQCNSLKDKRQMRWHPLVIRFALNLKYMSSSA